MPLGKNFFYRVLRDGLNINVTVNLNKYPEKCEYKFDETSSEDICELYYCHPQHFLDDVMLIDEDKLLDRAKLTSFKLVHDCYLDTLSSKYKIGFGHKIQRVCDSTKNWFVTVQKLKTLLYIIN